jgi:hypothetical protein
MSQEGTNLPQEVEGSHDQATAPHGNIPAGVGSPTATVMLAGSNPSSGSKLASAVNNAGLSERASLAVLSVVEDNNAMSKIASPVVFQAGEDSNAASKNASPAVLLASEENKAEFKLASPVVLLAGEEKGNDATGSKLASLAMLHDCDNSKAGSHAGVDSNAARSKLARPAVLHAGDSNNGGSKIASPAVPQAIVGNTTSSKIDSPPAVLHPGEHNNAGFKLPNPAVLHASKDMDNSAGRPKFASPALLHAGEDNKARTKLAIQAVSHAGGNTGSSRLTRSAAAALHAAKDNASKLAIQVVPYPHAGKDNNAGSSKAATRPAAVDAGESNAKEGKNNVAGEQRAHEADVGGGSRKGNAAAVEDADPNLHIFTERERRKKTKNMFSTLHALFPQLPDKVRAWLSFFFLIEVFHERCQDDVRAQAEKNRSFVSLCCFVHFSIHIQITNCMRCREF